MNIARVVRREHGLDVRGNLAGRRKKELLLRHRAENRVDFLVVVRPLLSIQALENHLKLAPENGDLVGVLSEGLRREETDEAVFPRDLAVTRELLDSDVIHSGQSVYGRAVIGLGDDQVGAPHHKVPDSRVGLADEHRLVERRIRFVTEHS